ncbi:cellulose binding domain-containing protein [Streptomyces sp. ACA25]|uniref:cellulose binding domain-containing protein n=1 Tax=Streptomyces sp. ACA25 TaxID=3022596 RepID=UPI0023070ACA|nr:cellulose binding domain-containing protein [Streptomyces sp. ACA25]MDB1088987.1 cellulose binding domain-containing protein [Streptomyces sp. ACA25]
MALTGGLLATASVATGAEETVAVSAEDYSWKNVRIDGGGFVPSIVFNRTEADLAYARTDIGGAYRWNEAGQEWIPLLDSVGWDNWGHSGVASIATDPVDPDRVYAAVGIYTNDWDPNNGAVMRSADRGETWQTTDLPFKLGGNMPGRGMGERLAVDPNDNRVLYLAAPSGNGLWRSNDSGAGWSEVTSFPNPGDYVLNPDDSWGYENDPIGVVWVTFDPATGTPGSPTQTLYAGVADLENNVYRSTDGGESWERVPGQPTGYLPHKGVLDEETGHLYLATSDNPGPYAGGDGEVWRLDTASGEWEDVSPVPAGDDRYFGFSGLTVDRQNPGTLMVTGYSSWWPDTQIFRSTDSGGSWTSAWDMSTYPQLNKRYAMDVSSVPWLTFGQNPQPPEEAPPLGWMTEGLEIDPHNPDRMMYGTGATIYGTTQLTRWDRDETFTVRPMVKGLEETAVNDLASPPSGAPLLSALGDIGGFRHTDLDAVPDLMYQSPFIGSTTSLDFAELRPETVVRVGTHVGDSDAATIGFSTDGGANWFAGNPPDGAHGGTVAAAADGARFVWSPENAAVHHTSGFGNSWTASTGIPQGAAVAADRVDPDLFYAFHEGTLYVSTDGGASFTAGASGGLPEEGNIRLAAAPGERGDLWLAGGTESSAYGLWRSTDAGSTLTAMPGFDAADTIGFGRGAPGSDYHSLYTSAMIDGVRGIYRSDNTGESWVRINDDSRQWAWTGGAIAGDPRVHGRVYVGTNGRGIIVGETAGSEDGGDDNGGGGNGGSDNGGGDNGGSDNGGGDNGGSDNGGGDNGGGDNGGNGEEPPGDADCSVTYRVTNEWHGGFQGDVTVANTGSAALENWELRWSFPQGQQIGQIWNAEYTQAGSSVVITPSSWNHRIAPGASVTFGFIGTWSGSNTAPESFSVDNSTCLTG